MKYVSGKILTIFGLKRGYIGFTDEKIIDIAEGNPPKKPIAKG